MWNMTTYKCKLKQNRLARETYRTENDMFALKLLTNTTHKFGVGTKIGSVGLVETNNFFYELGLKHSI